MDARGNLYGAAPDRGAVPESVTGSLARNWWAVLLRGVASIVFGVLTFALPIVTLAVLVLLFGAYAIVEGVFNLVSAIRGHGAQPRWVLVLEGIVSVLAGLATFALPGLTALVLGILSVAFGVFMVLAPAAGAVAVVLWIGAYAVVFGVFLVALSFRLRRWRSDERPAVARAA